MDKDKKKRFETQVLPLLKCVKCGHGRFDVRDEAITCRKCQTIYPLYNHIPLMTLTPEKTLHYSEEVVVENRYSEQWIELIENAGKEWVLDLGSGNNPDQYANLIKMEIYPLPNVDVVGYGEKLPFKANCFRTVFSGAVIEHVQNPFDVVRNIRDVLKPGGVIYIETAFLQPVHAFPDHYFNMTRKGLEYLCADFEKIASGVNAHQMPSFTLNWILLVWTTKLKGDAQQEFLNTTVQEILDEYQKDPFSQRFMETFANEDKEQLACGVYFKGKKAGSKMQRRMQALKIRMIQKVGLWRRRT